MLTTSSKYAIKAVLFLALHSSENHKLMVKDIFDRINVPKEYLAKILQVLSRQGIISSSRGPKGGFYLSDANKELPLISIVDVIEGRQRLVSCMLSIRECDSENPCALHDLVGNANSYLLKNLEETTIAKLLKDIQEGKAVLPL
ncbi:RrF2 family transcriptional regulator [Flagellimonas sp. 2504JD1-5]